MRYPTTLYRLTVKEFKNKVRSVRVTQMRQYSLVRQKFRYVGVIALILIFTVALC
jgi:hypothetical protein